MKNKKYLIIISVIAGMVIMVAHSCKKPSPDPITGPESGGPELPGTPYDYVAANLNMPTYIRDFISAQNIDNTTVENPITNDGATLGRVLFYDKQLSVNNTIACASCHHQDKGFTDGVQFSKGFDNGLTRRNSMSIINLRFFKFKKMFWDLRAGDIETQALLPIQDMIEMGQPSLTALENKLKTLSYYPALFKKAFGSTDINADRIAKALAQFLRSIVSFHTKYDDGLSNNFAAFTNAEKAGFQKVKQLNCVECHSDLSNISAHQNPSFLILENTGINTGFGSNNALDIVYSDNGIGEKTGEPKDMGTFKIPALRNVELTAPYMHDGRFTTLEEVLTHYQSGVKNNANRGIQLPSGGYGTALTDIDKENIIAFLKTLTDHSLASDPKYANPFK